jgi:hypothetical protein
MSKVLVFIAIIALIIFSYIFYVNYKNDNKSSSTETENMPTVVDEPEEASPAITPESQDELSTGSQEASMQLPNATVSIPEFENATVKLVNGEADYKNGNEQAHVYMMPDLYAERVTDQGYDLFGVMSVSYGGSGSEIYLVMFQYYADSLKHTDSIWIGDRVNVEQIGTRNSQNPEVDYDSVVQYLEHGKDQAMAETPNVKKTMTAGVKDHKFTDSVVTDSN